MTVEVRILPGSLFLTIDVHLILVLVLAAWPARFFLGLVTGPLVTGQRSSGDRPPIGAIGDAALYCTC